MNKRRLLKLADLLEADAKNKKGIKFDLGVWAAPADHESNLFDENGKSKPVPVDCNTSACAIGLACISGAFKRAGLTYSFMPSFHGDGFRLVPQFGDFVEFSAAQELFGIDREQASFLFDSDLYPHSHTRGAAGERFVAKRIRDFVAGKVGPESV